MSKLRLLVATGDYDRVQALKRGQVEIEGCALDHATLDPGQTFQRLFRMHEFDISEMSFSTYLLALATGDFPYRALPIFLSRVFPHGSIYVRTDRSIRGPRDLIGRSVGVPNYHFTRGLVVRGMLQDEYGVSPRDLRWRIGGVDRPEDFSYVAKPSPPGVEIDFIAPGQCLGDQLLRGEIDAIVSYRDPQVFTGGAPYIGRLFPDFRRAEQDWFQRVGVFPTMHVVGIRSELVASHPWLPIAVCRAFEAAKAACLPNLADLDALSVTLPWLAAETAATVSLMGRNFWPYGLPKNRGMVEAQSRWSHEQGLSNRLNQPDDIFEASTLSWDP
ncbi:MAG: ABC transporter substrate-binding protein [Alphaproteobacteria bacterium]